MDEAPKFSESERERQAWLAALGAVDFRVMLDLMRSDFGTPFEEGINYPEWVIFCGKKVCPAMFPKLYELRDAHDGLRNAYYIGLTRAMIEGSQLLMVQAAAGLPPLIDRELTQEENARVSDVLFGKDSGLMIPENGDSLVPDGIMEELEEDTSKFSLEEWGLYYAGSSDGCLMLAGRNAATLATNIYSLWVQYPEACFGLVGDEGEGWKVATFTRATMYRC